MDEFHTPVQHKSKGKTIGSENISPDMKNIKQSTDTLQVFDPLRSNHIETEDGDLDREETINLTYHQMTVVKDRSDVTSRAHSPREDKTFSDQENKILKT